MPQQRHRFTAVPGLVCKGNLWHGNYGLPPLLLCSSLPSIHIFLSTYVHVGSLQAACCSLPGWQFLKSDFGSIIILSCLDLASNILDVIFPFCAHFFVVVVKQNDGDEEEGRGRKSWDGTIWIKPQLKLASNLQLTCLLSSQPFGHQQMLRKKSNDENWNFAKESSVGKWSQTFFAWEREILSRICLLAAHQRWTDKTHLECLEKKNVFAANLDIHQARQSRCFSCILRACVCPSSS